MQLTQAFSGLSSATYKCRVFSLTLHGIQGALVARTTTWALGCKDKQENSCFSHSSRKFANR